MTRGGPFVTANKQDLQGCWWLALGSGGCNRVRVPATLGPRGDQFWNLKEKILKATRQNKIHFIKWKITRVSFTLHPIFRAQETIPKPLHTSGMDSWPVQQRDEGCG